MRLTQLMDFTVMAFLILASLGPMVPHSKPKPEVMVIVQKADPQPEMVCAMLEAAK